MQSNSFNLVTREQVQVMTTTVESSRLQRGSCLKNLGRNFFAGVTGSLIGFAGLIAAGSAARADVEYRIGGRVSASTSDDRRSSQLVCTMSLFFSMDREDRFDARLVSKQNPHVAELDGRGLLSCKNDQGFTTETPVLADLEADLPPLTRTPASESFAATAPGEISFSANTDPFVVPREVNQIYDVYNVREFSWQKPAASSGVSLTFRGGRNDLVIGMKMNSRTSNLTGLKIKSLRLSFDDDAPDLNDKI